MGPVHPRDERIWQLYAAAAISAGHRRIDAIDEIASDATALHRRKFPYDIDDIDAIAPTQQPAQAPTAPASATDPGTGGAPSVPVATVTSSTTTTPPAPTAPADDANTTTKPAKGKDSTR